MYDEAKEDNIEDMSLENLREDYRTKLRYTLKK